MGDKRWKVAERRVAEFLGGARNPLSGSNSRHTAGDVIHDDLYVEVKYRASFAAVTLMRETVEMARKEGKIPVVVLVEKGQKDGRYYLVREKDMESVALEVLKSHGYTFEEDE